MVTILRSKTAVKGSKTPIFGMLFPIYQYHSLAPPQLPPTATNQEKLRSAFEELNEMLIPGEPFTAVIQERLDSSGYHWAQRIAWEGKI